MDSVRRTEGAGAAPRAGWPVGVGTVAGDGRVVGGAVCVRTNRAAAVGAPAPGAGAGLGTGTAPVGLCPREPRVCAGTWGGRVSLGPYTIMRGGRSGGASHSHSRRRGGGLLGRVGAPPVPVAVAACSWVVGVAACPSVVVVVRVARAPPAGRAPCAGGAGRWFCLSAADGGA